MPQAPLIRIIYPNSKFNHEVDGKECFPLPRYLLLQPSLLFSNCMFAADPTFSHVNIHSKSGSPVLCNSAVCSSTSSDTSVLKDNTSTSLLRKKQACGRCIPDRESWYREIKLPQNVLSSFFHLLIPTDRAEAMKLAVLYKRLSSSKKEAVCFLNAILAHPSLHIWTPLLISMGQIPKFLRGQFGCHLDAWPQCFTSQFRA